METIKFQTMCGNYIFGNIKDLDISKIGLINRLNETRNRPTGLRTSSVETLATSPIFFFFFVKAGGLKWTSNECKSPKDILNHLGIIKRTKM